MSDEDRIAVIDDDGRLRDWVHLVPFYIHQDKSDEGFVTEEGSAGLEHYPDLCRPDCVPELTVCAFVSFS